MEPFIVFGVFCLAILLISGILNGAFDVLTYHKSTLYPEPNATPQWWPPQKKLKRATIRVNWIMVVAVVGLVIWLIAVNHVNYCLNLLVAGIIIFLLGCTIGIFRMERTVRTVCKQHGIKVIRRCP